MPKWMSVLEAAEALDVRDRQIRNLIAKEELEAERVGGSWVVSAASVEARRRRRAAPGRPPSPASAWRVLAHVDGVLRTDAPVPAEASDARVRYRLRNVLRSLPDAGEWGPWLRNRAEAHRVWFHPAAVRRIAGDARARRSDPSSDLGLDVADLAPVYVDEREFRAFIDQHHGQLVTGAERVEDEVVVMAVPELPADIDWREHTYAATLVDLCGHPDARVRDAARGHLQHAAAILAATPRSAQQAR